MMFRKIIDQDDCPLGIDAVLSGTEIYRRMTGTYCLRLNN
jgi:hypothetical protein